MPRPPRAATRRRSSPRRSGRSGRAALDRLEPAARAAGIPTPELAARGAPAPRALLARWLAAPYAQPGIERQLVDRFRARADLRAFLDARAVPTEDWPYWATDRRSIEALAGLAAPELARRAIDSAFPLRDVDLALARSRLEAASGLHRASLASIETVLSRMPDDLPSALLPDRARRLLYPDPYAALVRREAEIRDVEPLLLTALMREESRFQADVVSAAAAHGLTQFVLPTARRIAPRIGLPEPTPADLHRPEVSIALGAAYLSELSAEFDGRRHVMLAAYNAGEPQAALWDSYCFSREAPEYLTKIGFRQTRRYVRKVLRSLAHYRTLSPARQRSAPER